MKAMGRAAATAMLAGLMLAQAQLLLPCGSWRRGYVSSGFWHPGYYIHRWCPVLPPRV